ncbi:MAG: D-tyrosyl-tRNA(Tyr) deacylase [Candidatus Micrarchaeota archaeon]|nr:D-tyrosyl-tRNA(Tyr) deacylase [Candidatus Micrarchaeota archaeon]
MHTIFFSVQDPAGVNIAKKLTDLFEFKKENAGEFRTWNRGETQLVELKTKLVDAEYLREKFKTEFFVFISKHRSETAMPCLTAHTPGNWGKAELGGKPQELCYCWPSKLKIVLNEMNSLNDLGWSVCAEVDHHGPLTNTPSIFVEIGSSEKEWANEGAGEIVARAVMKMLETSKTFKTAFGIGGGHYAPSFTKAILENEYAVGHMLPKYRIDEVTFDSFRQGVERSAEKTELALIDWKGTNKNQKDKVIEFLKVIGLPYERI